MVLFFVLLSLYLTGAIIWWIYFTGVVKRVNGYLLEDIGIIFISSLLWIPVIILILGYRILSEDT